MIGANGVGKSTLLRIITGELAPESGAVTREGGLGVMRQFIADGTVHDLLLSVAPGAIRDAAWMHSGGFEAYHRAGEQRFARLDDLRRRWDEEHAKLRSLMLMYKQKAAYSSDMASRHRAAQSRLARFEELGPLEAQPRAQHLEMRLRGGRIGKRVLTCDSLELTGLMHPFNCEAWYGDRIAVLGSNGSGKSHFLRLLAAGGTDPDPAQEPVSDALIEPVPHTGTARLGARVRPGWFAQNRGRPELAGRTLLEILHRGDERRSGLPRDEASRVLARYDLAKSAEQRFETLSGGQQARFQVLLLELGGACRGRGVRERRT